MTTEWNEHLQQQKLQLKLAAKPNAAEWKPAIYKIHCKINIAAKQWIYVLK